MAIWNKALVEVVISACRCVDALDAVELVIAEMLLVIALDCEEATFPRNGRYKPFLERLTGYWNPWALGLGEMPSCPYAVIDLAAFLVGEWAVARHIADRRADSGSDFEGLATFVVDPNNDSLLLYCESGIHVTANGRMDAQRQYLYAITRPHPHRADITFADGSAFHDLDLSSGSWCTQHLCSPDTYEAAFEVQDVDRWTTTWTVRGPQKDSLITTIYQRRRQ